MNHGVGKFPCCFDIAVEIVQLIALTPNTGVPSAILRQREESIIAHGFSVDTYNAMSVQSSGALLRKIAIPRMTEQVALISL